MWSKVVPHLPHLQTTTTRPLAALVNGHPHISTFRNLRTVYSLPLSMLSSRIRTLLLPPKPKFRKKLTISKAEFSTEPPLDLTEDNVRQVIADARVELAQIFDSSVGITGVVELAELDGPFVRISLRGKFWHKRSTVLARVGNYLRQRIPEILEVDVENEKQLDDSPENF